MFEVAVTACREVGRDLGAKADFDTVGAGDGDVVVAWVVLEGNDIVGSERGGAFGDDLQCCWPLRVGDGSVEETWRVRICTAPVSASGPVQDTVVSS